MCRLSLPTCRVIGLVDVLDWEVRGVKVRPEVWPEWSIHLADGVPMHSSKVGMGLDISCPMRTAIVTQTVWCVAEKPVRINFVFLPMHNGTHALIKLTALGSSGGPSSGK